MKLGDNKRDQTQNRQVERKTTVSKRRQEMLIFSPQRNLFTGTTESFNAMR